MPHLIVGGVSVDLVEEVWEEADDSQHDASQVKGGTLEHAVVHPEDAKFREWLPGNERKTETFGVCLRVG